MKHEKAKELAEVIEKCGIPAIVRTMPCIVGNGDDLVVEFPISERDKSALYVTCGTEEMLLEALDGFKKDIVKPDWYFENVDDERAFKQSKYTDIIVGTILNWLDHNHTDDVFE